MGLMQPGAFVESTTAPSALISSPDPRNTMLDLRARPSPLYELCLRILLHDRQSWPIVFRCGNMARGTVRAQDDEAHSCFWEGQPRCLSAVCPCEFVQGECQRQSVTPVALREGCAATAPLKGQVQGQVNMPAAMFAPGQ